VTIAEYQKPVKAHLLSSAIISSFRVVRERETQEDGHLRVRLTLTDESLLESSEYVRRSLDGEITVITYSYHWADSEQNLIRRWDNVPNYPDLPNAPHHIHDGKANQVVPGVPVDIYAVLEIIQNEIS